jgi:hypothetical protein
MFKILLYIDPGTGSLLFQLLLSGVISVFIYFKKVVSFIKNIFRKNTNLTRNDIVKNDKKK